MFSLTQKMAERLLTLATRLVGVPVAADFAYGPFGRLVLGTVRRIQTGVARLRPVPIGAFNGSYFFAGKVLQLAVTNVCNARCSFCAYRLVADSGQPSGIMSMEVFTKAVGEYASLGGTYIDLTPTVGDPLLDPTLTEKIRFCRANGIVDVAMTTNAIALAKRDLYKQVIDAGTTIVCISLPALDAPTYKQAYGIDRYPDVIRGISLLLKYNKEKGEAAQIILRFRNPQKPSALIRSPDFKEHIKPYLSRKVTCNFTVDYDNWGGSITQDDLFGVMKMRAVPPPYRVPCANLLNFTVRYNGTVRLCGCRLKVSEEDDLVVGDIRQNTFQDLGRSQKVHDIINGFYQGRRPSTCENCSFYIPLTSKQARSLLNPRVK